MFYYYYFLMVICFLFTRSAPHSLKKNYDDKIKTFNLYFYFYFSLKDIAYIYIIIHIYIICIIFSDYYKNLVLYINI